MSKSKFERTISDNHREYLDLDTDEEEFGKQETPEPEDEVPPEPEKPVFTDEDLNTLVQYVKNLTVLPVLKISDWNENNETVISEYFREPKNSIMTIFFEQHILTALLGHPSYTDNGLVYFLRCPWQIYDVSNFLSDVIFGSINKKTEMTMLNFMENIYAPVAFDSEEWPETMKDDTFANLHELIMCLSDIVYKPLGLTMLYIPKMNNEVNFDPENMNMEIKCNEYRNRIGRLEKVARVWIGKIREALCTLPQTAEKYLKNIYDEFEYWNHRHDNLKTLLQQLSNDNVISIVTKLKQVDSFSVIDFKTMIKEIRVAVKETSSNIAYLKLLLESCEDLQIPSDIESHVSKTLLVIRFIWKDSPFYNTIQGIETLCRALSIHIVNLCRNYVDLGHIFNNGVDKAEEILKTCISCCRSYSAIYNQITKAFDDEDKCWNVIKDNVFKYIEIFEQRCQDMIEICNTTIVFERSKNVCPLASGPKGKIYEMKYQDINPLFCESLRKITVAFEGALDVTNIQWYNHIIIFRHEIEELENMIQLLIDKAFEDDVHNVQDAIEMIYTLLQFRSRKRLKDILYEKWLQTWKMFDTEIRSQSNFPMDDTFINILSIKLNFNENNFSRLNINYLSKLCEMMMKASDWMDSYCHICI